MIKVGEKPPALCDALQDPLDRHIDALVDNGQAILQAGADEVLVTGDELASGFDGRCRD